jgi:SAM-dependent methyltransferase
LPQRLYDLIGEYFEKAGSTLDVGCGIGRDTNWLIEQGYGYAFEIWVVGIDKKAGGLNWLTGFFCCRFLWCFISEWGKNGTKIFFLLPVFPNLLILMVPAIGIEPTTFALRDL